MSETIPGSTIVDLSSTNMLNELVLNLPVRTAKRKSSQEKAARSFDGSHSSVAQLESRLKSALSKDQAASNSGGDHEVQSETQGAFAEELEPRSGSIDSSHHTVGVFSFDYMTCLFCRADRINLIYSVLIVP